MGLLDNQTQHEYYNGSNLGNYQFVTLENIISAFMISYVGEGKIISKVSRTDVQFHAMRALQELSYDVLRSFKTQEIEVPNTLTMMLPQDYVNYTKITRLGDDGIERILYPTGKTSNPFAIEQNADGSYVTYDPTPNTAGTDLGNMDNEPTTLMEQVDNTDESNAYVYNSGTEDAPVNTTVQVNDNAYSDTWTNFQDPTEPTTYSNDAVDNDIDYRGRRYGLDPQHAQSNGTFFIDQLRGYIHFGSRLSGQTIVLHYVSDGLGTDEEMVVHKFCEEACYKHIAYSVISAKSNIPEYIVQRFKKEKFAETRKAKIRLSNIKIEEFTQVLKGLSKPIK